MNVIRKMIVYFLWFKYIFLTTRINQTTLHLCWSLQQGIYCKYKYYKYIQLHKTIEKNQYFIKVMTVKYINFQYIIQIMKMY